MNSIESGTRWRTSSYSNGEGACVEVTTLGGAVGMRDSKLRGTGPELWPSSAAARAFLTGLVNGSLNA